MTQAITTTETHRVRVTRTNPERFKVEAYVRGRRETMSRATVSVESDNHAWLVMLEVRGWTGWNMNTHKTPSIGAAMNMALKWVTEEADARSRFQRDADGWFAERRRLGEREGPWDIDPDYEAAQDAARSQEEARDGG